MRDLHLKFTCYRVHQKISTKEYVGVMCVILCVVFHLTKLIAIKWALIYDGSSEMNPVAINLQE